MLPKFKYEYVSYDELLKAYLDCRKRKRRTANSCMFEMFETEKLFQLYIDLNNRKYEVGRSIAFTVRRPVIREVFAADFRDRVVHHLLINRIIDFCEEEFIEDSYSCRVGKGTEYAIQRCKYHIEECSEKYTKDAYIYKGDLKSFFMTIDKEKLYERLCKFLKDKGNMSDIDYEYNCWLIKLIIFNEPQKNCVLKQKKSCWKDLPKNKSLFYCDKNHGLPIGNLTSQLFANFYLSEFDHWVNDELGFKHYGRYVDDFFIVDNDKEKILSALPKIKEKLKEYGVTLHPKKFYLQDVKKGVKFVGGVVKENRIYVAKRTIGNAWEAAMRINQLLEAFEDDKGVIDHCSNVINSYLGFLRHRNSYRVRKKMLNWDILKPFWKYSYYDKDYKKVTVFIEYCDAGCNPKKHQSKEFHELNSKKETEALARWLKKRGYFDEKNSDDIRKNTVSR